MDSTWRFYKLPKNVAERTDLPASAKIVLAVLIDRIGQNDDCWPGLLRLAKDSGMAKTSVIRAIRCLEAKKIIQINRREQGQSNHYRISTWYQNDTTWYQNDTSGSSETIPEVVAKRYSNQKDQLNKTHIYNCPNPESLRLAQLLLDLILQRKADFKRPNLQNWARHIERMIQIDNRKPARIEAVIRWCQADAFEQVNILSTEKLRIRFDQLEMKMAGHYGKQQPRYNRDFASQQSSIGTVIQM
jgi:transcription initiation factor IIE alpha subunit